MGSDKRTCIMPLLEIVTFNRNHSLAVSRARNALVHIGDNFVFSRLRHYIMIFIWVDWGFSKFHRPQLKTSLSVFAQTNYMCLWIKISSLESRIPLFLFHDGVLLMPCISDLCHNEAIASWFVLFLLPVGCNVQNMKVVLNLTSLSPDCGIFLGKMSYELYRFLVWLVFFHVFSLNKCWFCSGGKAGWLIELRFLASHRATILTIFYFRMLKP